MRLRCCAAITPRRYFTRTCCPAIHTQRPHRDRTYRWQSEHAHRIGLPRMQYRSEQHHGRADKNQTQSSHLNQSPDYHDSLSPLPPSLASEWSTDRAMVASRRRLGKMPDYGMDYDWPAVSCVRRKHADFCETRIRRETGKIAKARDPMDRTPTGLSLLRGQRRVGSVESRLARPRRRVFLDPDATARCATRPSVHSRLLIAAWPSAGRGRRSK
jgi:hypothetical protein